MNLDLKDLVSLAVPVGVALLGLVLGWVVRRIVVTRLGKRAEAEQSTAERITVAAVRGPVVLWFFIAGAYAAVQVTDLSPRVADVISKVLLALVILSISWAAARITGALVRAAAAQTGGALPSATLISNIARILVLTVGVLVLLQTLGISIAPIITALGVGGLAVALALQDTLANLFAGVHILASRQVRPGDYVKLASGEEGFVMDVTWRQTTIRQLPNNIIIVPNAKIASTITTNYNLPESELSILMQVGVHYDSDLEVVERVTKEVASEVMRDVEGGVAEWDPLIRFHTFGESSINFTVVLRATEYVNQYPLKSEFMKRLQRRYKQEGIVIPFPIRTVRLQSDE